MSHSMKKLKTKRQLLLCIIAGWTADDIALMATQDACRDVIAKFTAGGRQRGGTDTVSPPDTARSDVTSYSAHSIDPPPEFGAPALDAPGM